MNNLDDTHHFVNMEGWRTSMRFALMIEAQQGLSYEDQLAIARHAEAGGFEGMFRSDHYQSFPGPAGRPTTDAWAVLAGLARETSRMNLGVLVSPVTFRRSGNLAKVVTTVDEMSGGRVEFGLGAGWNEEEHRRHGFPFPPIRERADMLEETLQVMHGLWDEPDGWSFDGRHIAIDDSIFQPRPTPARPDGRRRPPIIVGGSGSPRSYRLAARYADEFNVSSGGPEAVARIYASLDEACRAADRDPASLRRSAMVGAMVGRDDAEVARRRTALLSEFGMADEGDEWFAERRTRWILGTPDEARAMVARFEAVGVERIMLQDFLPRDLDHIDLLAETFLR
jgi:alkanesulfonate monooxygenase